MNRSDKLNFNESLLSHSLYKSQSYFANSSFQKKSCSSLLSQLNMTYSRLTTIETKHDIVKQNPSQCQQIDYEFENQQQTNEFQLQESFGEQCQNCKRMKNQLKAVQVFLLEMEGKIVQKQNLLSDRYKGMVELLEKKTQELKFVKEMYDRLREDASQFKEIHNLPKLQLNTNLIKQSHRVQPSSSETAKAYLSTFQSTMGSDNRKFTRLPNKRLTQSIFQQKQKQKQNDQLKQSTLQRKATQNSNGSSSIQLQYTSSERSTSEVVDSFRPNFAIQKNTSIFYKASQEKQPEQKKQKREKNGQLYKLRFENSSLKSYNSVLLEHVKPRTLAERVFAVGRG